VVEALQLADAGKAEPARLKFQQAWAVFKAPAVLYNLARAEQLTGHDLEALDHFRLFLRVGATDVKITDAMRDKAKQNAAELAKKVGQVDIEVPPTARVSVDGKPLDETPKEPVPVQPGRHTIEAAFDGRVKSVTVECAAGTVVKAKLDFEAGGGSEPPGEERPKGSAYWVVPTVLGVAGLVGIGVGIGFAASSQSAKSDSEDIRRANPGVCAQSTELCASYDSKRSDAESAATLSYVGYIAGGALLAGAAVTAIVLWPRAKEHNAKTPSRGIHADAVTPLVGNGTMGAGLVGHF